MNIKYKIIVGIIIVITSCYFIFIKSSYHIAKTSKSPDGKYELVIYVAEVSLIHKLIPANDEIDFLPAYVELLDSRGNVLTDTSKSYWCCDFLYGDLGDNGWDLENNKVWLTELYYIDLNTYKPSCSCL